MEELTVPFELKNDCFAYSSMRHRCETLKDFYSGLERCKGCPFYKTKAEYEQGLKIGMTQAEYAAYYNSRVR